jgi:hypothetical protein
MDHECDMLVKHIGDAVAQKIVRLSYLPSSSGIAQEAFDLLKQVKTGLAGMYGADSDMGVAIMALRLR